MVGPSLSGDRVGREMVRIAEMRGYLCMVVSGNDSEQTSKAILKWQEDRKINWKYFAPEKPIQKWICGKLQWEDAS